MGTVTAVPAVAPDADVNDPAVTAPDPPPPPGFTVTVCAAEVLDPAAFVAVNVT
ncbi:hypothetical protein [Blastococcus sp. CT_GayMR19]|uniref:hypothetical protein n=1 Tax=Blastococcus sp. CT_GayMR19 TaxID=2559608 RepID=UPI001430D8B7|nr:hypothetical protein [Blastococcus sp. CT_GayMR19]